MKKAYPVAGARDKMHLEPQLVSFAVLVVVVHIVRLYILVE